MPSSASPRRSSVWMWSVPACRKQVDLRPTRGPARRKSPATREGANLSSRRRRGRARSIGQDCGRISSRPRQVCVVPTPDDRKWRAVRSGAIKILARVSASHLVLVSCLAFASAAQWASTPDRLVRTAISRSGAAVRLQTPVSGSTSLRVPLPRVASDIGGNRANLFAIP